MKRPLGVVALLYGGGLLLAEVFHPPLAVLFPVSLALAAAALTVSRARPALLAALLVFAGWTNLVWRTAVVSPFDLRTLLADSPQQAAIRGRLCETPSARIQLRDGKELERTLARVEVTALNPGAGWQRASGRVLVTTRGALPGGFFAGQDVRVSGVLAPPPRPLADGLFDYRSYLRRQGIYFQLSAESAADWRRVSSNSIPPLADRFVGWARATLARGLPARDEPLRLLWAMTLGWKTALTREVSEPFRESGTMHIFAISGLHVALIAGILVSLLRVVRLSRAACGLVVIPALWFYAAATGWQPSAIRATIMMSIIIGGWSLRRPGDLLNSLAAAAFIILLWDPQQLLQASFQLSFFVVLSLALALPPLENWRERLLQTDPLLPPELVPRWRRRLGRPLRWLTAGLATSLAAWLGSWPLTAFYFHLFSPVTLLANLFIIPLSGVALASSVGSLLCAAWLPWANELFNHSGWFWMRLMTAISVAAAKLPGAFLYVRSPGAADFAIYYAALIAVLSGAAFAPGRRRWTTAAAAGVAVFYFCKWEITRPVATLTILPLNGGSAMFCDAPGRANDLLFDCGNGNAVEFVTEPFLHGQGVNRLSCLALSHGDLREVGGVEPLRASLPVERIALSPAPCRSRAYRRVVSQLAAAPNCRRVVSRGDRLGFWTVLHPAAGENFPRADDGALVLRGEIGGTRVLLLSDLGRDGQEELLERAGDLRADIVVAGLPNQGEPLCDALLAAIGPKLVIVADSEFPATRRAAAPLRERLRRRGVPVVYTRSAGAVTVTIRKSGFSLRTAFDGSLPE